jgi:hypothetical protein
VSRLGNASRKHARVALGIASVSFQTDERVETVVQGQIDGTPGVAVLTDRRLLLVNEAVWEPLVETVAITPTLRVDGEADGRIAGLVITSPAGIHRIDGMKDVELAKEFAAQLRTRTADA